MEIAQLAREVLEPLGYELLELQFSQGRGQSTLVVRIDRLDEQPVTMEDLARASRVFGLELDTTDSIEGQYHLELESPGPKRPLVRARHFERMMGLKVRVKQQGDSFYGVVRAVTENAVRFELENGEEKEIAIPGIKANLAEWPNEHR